MILPNDFEEKNQLSNMKVGQSGYIVPWGMWVDVLGNCFLNENYTFHSEPGGTVQLKITRIESGYVAHLNELKPGAHKWERQNGPSFASPESVCYGRVVGFGEEIIKITSPVKGLVSFVVKALNLD